MPQQRGFDGHRVRPPHVMRAVLTDDKPMLSELGKRGAASRQRLAAKKKVHGDSNNAKIEGLIASMHTVVAATHTLDGLREQWSKTARFLKPARPLPAHMQKLVKALAKVFMERARKLMLDEEFRLRAEEANEHICPID